MNRILVAAAALNQTPMDWTGNTARIIDCIEAAKGAGARLLLLPELAISGYGCEDAFQRPGTLRKAMRALATIAKASEGIHVAVGLPLMHKRKIYNAAAKIVDGRLGGFYCKKHLAGDGVHYEFRWFAPWPIDVQGLYRFDDSELANLFDCEEVPIGDIYFEIDGVTLGFETCEDAWVADRSGRALAAKGVDIILNPSASHFAFGKTEVRRGFVKDGSRAFAAAYIYSNLLGNESGRIIYDGQCLIAQNGEILAEGPRFSFSDYQITYASLDIDATRRTAAKTASFRTNPGPDESCIRIRTGKPSWFSQSLGDIHVRERDAWEQSPDIQFEEFTRAGALGLFDYLRKARSGGYVISLSGGADSAAVAMLVFYMIHLAFKSIGQEGVARRLAYLNRKLPTDARELIHELLSCVYQGSANSSNITVTAATKVAAAIGAKYFEFDIAPIVTEYERLMNQALGRAPTWEEFDIPLQNLQARTRSPSAWGLANFTGKTLLNTSNRSEAAVGYATMDGDTSGSLNPIGGIDKAFLLRWLKWLMGDGPMGEGNIPELSVIVAQKPTAELRPLAMEQTDETDLMPYPVLNTIESLFIRDGKDPVEVFRALRRIYSDLYSLESYYIWVKRFVNLWSRNQWKRERFAISFHYDDRSLDPKTWCRFPVLNGGFKQELLELDELFHDLCAL